MANVIEYKCPNCGASLKFDITTQNITCEYCENSFTLEEVKEYNEASNVEQAIDIDFEKNKELYSNEELNNLSSYYCDMCGANIVCDNTTSATFCPYCESPIILKGRLTGDRRPDYVIPFKKDTADCKALFDEYTKHKLFLPSAFRKRSEINNFKGLYVPFWLFNLDVDAKYSFNGEIETRKTQGDYEIIKTDYYKIYREGRLGFDYVPVDGASKIENVLMESVEPFDFNEAVKFDFAYLSGHFAERYDVQKEECQSRVFERITVSTTQLLRRTISNKYDTVEVDRRRLNYEKINVYYALYPVWFINTKYNDKDYTFIINGQNGKTAGNLPTSKGKYAGFFGGITFTFALIFSLIYILGVDSSTAGIAIFVSILIGAMIATIFCEVNRRKLKGIRAKNDSNSYYRNDSLSLYRNQDVFLRSSTRKRRINKK